jgi:Flp pilus assembly protein TadG
MRAHDSDRGQILVVAAVLLTILLAAAGFSIDIGRQEAERRHVQNAADAGALAACQALINGDGSSTAVETARRVASINLEGSPAGATATIADPPTYSDLNGDGTITSSEITSGVLVYVHDDDRSSCHVRGERCVRPGDDGTGRRRHACPLILGGSLAGWTPTLALVVTILRA